MKKSALRVALAVFAAAPALARVPSAPTGTHENLEQFADLTRNARTAASLENANTHLSRGYDASAAGPTVLAAAQTPQNPDLKQAPPEQGVHYTPIPQPDPSQITPDKAPPDNSAEEEKKKKNLQRAMIGGAGGAAVLAVFGFIFGGPVGALVGAGVGFALLAGVTHLNNNPI